MPKKPTDSLIGLRFELNETERDALRFYTTSASIRNIGVGVGAVAKPVLDNLAVIMAAIVATEGLEAIRESANRWQQNFYDNREQYKIDRYEEYLQITDDDPAMTFEEYSTTVTEQSYDYRAANWWQRNVGNPLRRFLGADPEE